MKHSIKFRDDLAAREGFRIIEVDGKLIQTRTDYTGISAAIGLSIFAVTLLGYFVKLLLAIMWF